MQASFALANRSPRLCLWSLLAAGVVVNMAAFCATGPITYYVDVNNPTPVRPYTNWATAAHVIQDAMNLAFNGDTVLVTNGLYRTGGHGYGSLTNRVYVPPFVTLKSVNGPDATIIEGYQVPGTVSGTNATRCVYLDLGARLEGFTLRNGTTSTNLGGVNQYSNGGGVYGGQSTVVSNCVMVGNSAMYGGGCARGTYYNCSISNNSAAFGGGAFSCTLSNCLVVSNMAFGNSTSPGDGGGAYEATMYYTLLVGNTGGRGGGASASSTSRQLFGCTLIGNKAISQYAGNAGGFSFCAGGGTYSYWMINCCLMGNSAAVEGGGTSWGTAENCTLVGNLAMIGGGASGSNLRNSILYNNTASQGSNWYQGSLTYCCTAPLPETGTSNIVDDPQLASASHLSFDSPCLGAGNPSYAWSRDIDREAWANPPAIGCDEVIFGSVTGAVSVLMQVSPTAVATGYPVSLTALITGKVNASRWEFGDGVILSNRPFASHSWQQGGDYSVVLRAYNENNPGGITATAVVRIVDQPVFYVDANNSNPLWPYSTWATAANVLQDAVDAAVLGTQVWVTNGLYRTGGRSVYGALTNRLAVTIPILVKSMNGPEWTIIEGSQDPSTTNGDSAVRCAYLTSGASLVGFTLRNGATRTSGHSIREQSGGGVWCDSMTASINNCIIRNNSAVVYGGGAYQGTLNNCVLDENRNSNGDGGGAFAAIMNNCSITRNAAPFGGGTVAGTLRNCIIFSNSAPVDPNTQASGLAFCYTPDAKGNMVRDPFLNLAAGDLHLASDSPCINAGCNRYATNPLDLDGNPRIVGGTVDIGAYEFQAPSSQLSYAWLQQYGLPTDGSADYADGDGDLMNNWQEWVAGTDPTNSASALRILGLGTNSTGVSVSWQSVTNRLYWLERNVDLGAPGFSTIKSGVAGQAGTTSSTDTNTAGCGRLFYRVGVALP